MAMEYPIEVACDSYLLDGLSFLISKASTFAVNERFITRYMSDISVGFCMYGTCHFAIKYHALEKYLNADLM